MDAALAHLDAVGVGPDTRAQMLERTATLVRAARKRRRPENFLTEASALGEGDLLWDTTKAISTPFDEAGVIELGFTHLADIRVTSLDDQTEYALDIDYSANAREGVIRRLPGSSIPEQGDVTVHFKVEHPPESIGQTALLREVGRRVVDEVHFVAADPEGEIAQLYKSVARQVAVKIAAKAKDFSSKFPSIKISKDT